MNTRLNLIAQYGALFAFTAIASTLVNTGILSPSAKIDRSVASTSTFNTYSVS